MASSGSCLTLALWLSLAPVVAPAGTHCAERDDWVTCLCEKWARNHERLYPGADTQVCGQLFNVTEIAKEFGSWQKQFAKVFSDSKLERARFVNFAYNVVFMRFINSSATNYSLAPNEFSDLTPEEFKKQREVHLEQAAPGHVLGSFHGAADSLPESHDWVEEGLISHPRHQGNTKSCWAFAVASTLEGGWAKRTGVLVELSPQQFVDCTGSWLSASYGGDLHTPVENVATEHDLCSARGYRYTGRDGTCKQEDPSVCVTQIPRGAVVGYRWAHRSEQGLMQALYLHGPVSLAIDGLSEQMMSYNSGVITFPCDGEPNHAVSAVGYGTHGSVPYWNIKNSWGTRWGEDGFFRLLRGQSGVNGHCSIFKLSPMIPVFTNDPDLLGQAGLLQQDNDKIFDDSSGQSGSDLESLARLARSPAVISVAVGLLACLFATCCCWVCCCQNKKDRRRGLDSLADDDESDEEEEEEDDDDDDDDDSEKEEVGCLPA